MSISVLTAAEAAAFEMRLLFLIISIFVILLPLLATSSSSYLPAYDYGRRYTPLDYMVDTTNFLGVNILNEHNFLNENNIAFSPYGLAGILIALYEGLDGVSAYQIRESLGLPSNRDVLRVGFRDIHRRLRSYFVPKEGFLAGLAFNNENVTFRQQYKDILQFYGFDYETMQIPQQPTSTVANRDSTSSSSTVETTTMMKETTVMETTTTPVTSQLLANEEDPMTTMETEDTREMTTTPQTTTPMTTTTPTTTTQTTTTPTTTTQTTATPTTTTQTTTAPTTTTQTSTTPTTTTQTTTTPTTTTQATTTTTTTTEAPTTTTTTAATTTTAVTTTTTIPTTTVTTQPTTTESDTSDSTEEAESRDSDKRTKKSLNYYKYVTPMKTDRITLFSPLFNDNHHYERRGLHYTRSFLANGYSRVQINYMTYDTALGYAYLPQLRASALRLPLDTMEYYILIILPEYEFGVNQLIKDLKSLERSLSLRYIATNLENRHVRAWVPSFTLKGFVILTSDLQKIGICDPFEPRQSDFKPMTNETNIYVRNIEQAITVTIRKYMEPANLKKRYIPHGLPVEFAATHPFLYFVMDSEIHVALMAGKIVNPLNSRII